MTNISLDKLINQQQIILDLNANTKDECIDEMVNILDKENKLFSKEIFIKAIYERENAISTSVGWGVAIPHARSDGVRETAICFGRKLKGIEWISNPSEIVNVVFLLAIPITTSNNGYMRILANLARSLICEKFRGSCLNAQCSEDVLKLISNLNGKNAGKNI